jgi:pimeloyl-ACP methyl ester carboxylesterase
MMSTFVLVHGAWHGRWAWEKVVPLLEEAGHKVEAPDLRGHGDDKTPVPEVSLQSYADRVSEVLDGQSEPVILVGHSMGGIVISEVAERHPEKVRLLVYLAAFLLPNGKTLLETAQTDDETLVLQNVEVDEDKGIVTIREDAAREVFYGDCSEEDVERAKERLQPQALAPFATPVGVGEENFGRVKRTYIECLQDRAIGPATQKRMYTELPCEKVVSMDTSHTPFLSAPEELVRHLMSLDPSQAPAA